MEKDRDRELAARIVKGDTEAFGTLVSVYRGKLFHLLFKLSGSREDAEEMLQDTFVRVFQYICRYNPGQSFSPWIYKIAVNTFKDYYRNRKGYDGRFTPLDSIEQFSAGPVDSPEMGFESREALREIVRLVQGLEEEQKIALVLKTVQGFSYREIGEIMGIRAETAKMKVSRARQKIGEAYAKFKAGD